jgi:hypothetical protein
MVARPDLRVEHPLVPHERDLAPGERRGFSADMPTFDAGDIVELDNLRDVLHIVGRIRYVDDIKVARLTGFCWAYDPRAREFFNPEKTSEYNYED